MSKTGPLSSVNCEAVELTFEVSKDKFDAEKLIEAVTKKRGTTICNTSGDDADYHVHFNWSIRENDVKLTVAFVTPSVPLNEKEKEPYAETVIQWLGQFFKNENAFADLGAHFSYPVAAKKSRFPLPFKLPLIPELETQIDGISFKLPSKPGGVSGILVLMDDTEMSIQIRGGVRINFQEFDPKSLTTDISSVVLQFTEDKQ